jgi:hypothetical protein
MVARRLDLYWGLLFGWVVAVKVRSQDLSRKP